MNWESNYLEHYGVLGMKWGIRRARNKGADYKYSSHSTKKWKRRARKFEKKGNVIAAKDARARAQASQDYDNARVRMAKNTTGFRTAAAVLMNQGYNAAMTYHAAGMSSGMAAVAGLSAYVSTPLNWALRASTKHDYIEKNMKKYLK